MPFNYPEVRREETPEILHGIPVQDPYRHLEDPDAPETVAFVEAQQKLFRDFVQGSDVREKVATRLTELNNFEKFGTPFKRGDNYYYFYNSGLQAQAVLYTQKTLDAEPSVFFDPNTLSADGTVSLNAYNFSKSGKLFAYALSTSGSDWVKIFVREVGSDKDLEQKPIEWAKFSKIEFTHDELGFFYTKYPTPNVSSEAAGTETDISTFAQVWYHKIGTSQDEDIVIYKNDDEPEYGQDDGYDVYITGETGRYLVLGIRKGCEPYNLVYYADLQEQFGCNSILGAPKLTEIVGEFNGSYFLIDSAGPILYFQTSFNAPKSRIVSYNVAAATKTVTTKTFSVSYENKETKTTTKTVTYVKPDFEEIISESHPISFVKGDAKNNKLVIVYMKDVKHVARVFDFGGNYLNDIELPSGCVIRGFGSEEGALFYNYASFITPGVIARYDFETGVSSIFRQTVVKGLEAEKYEVKQVFYNSEDGTRIPMWITHKKGLVLDGNNPTILY
ncbi:hypothetical protein HDU99_003137, partial [Rhizoclosmatium hyalinum]